MRLAERRHGCGGDGDGVREEGRKEGAAAGGSTAGEENDAALESGDATMGLAEGG